MSQGNMVPETDWSRMANGFQEIAPSQAILCVACVELGVPTPPAQVVVFKGDSLCLDHLRQARGD